jgi:glyoxylase-like metal-dependent hydrolase (beta-lactamase superfamily II)
MSNTTTKPLVHGLFDPSTWTVTYVVYEKPGSACAIIDSVLDYDPKSGRTKTTSADKVIDFVRANNLTVEWILETHAHADHILGLDDVRPFNFMQRESIPIFATRDVIEVVERMLSVKPSGRPQSYDLLLGQLEDARRALGKPVVRKGGAKG